MTQSAMNPTDIYVIGDLQGCCHALDRLLQRIDDGADREFPAQPLLWFAGDLVNRGPDSLGALRRVRALGDRATVVLGNHDLNLLAVAAGVRRVHRSDTLNPILSAPDREELLRWLRHRPLAHFAAGHLLVHAGVLPSWGATEVLALAGEVEAELRGPSWREFLATMYGDLPNAWNPSMRGSDRLRVIVNALTRIRYTTPSGTMEFVAKEALGAGPIGYVPWFECPSRKTAEVTVVCGHWSTLGLINRPNLIALDTGCVWGGQLTAMRLRDRHILQIDCSGER
jgi:bis(5'-nucleosyl)-tetraphosphatase (symmetrical)